MNEDELHGLAFEFFRVFSRFEYALKAADFHKGMGPAEADRGKFATENESRIADIPPGNVADAISFLLAEPPKKQFIGSAGLEWRNIPASQGSPARDLFTYVRRVRNNLFHGGKFNGHGFAPERSEKLLTACLAFMRWSLENNHSIRDADNG